MRLTEHPATAQPNGLDVYIITYDEAGNEERLLPSELTGDVADRSRHLRINRGSWTIDRIKYGPFIAAESQLKLVNVGSLGRALVSANPLSRWATEWGGAPVSS